MFNLGWLDPFNPSLDKGDAYYDVRHRFTISGVWDVRGPSAGIGRQALGGWTLAPIFQARTGTPFSICDCTAGYNVCPYAFASGNVPTTPTTPLTPTATPNVNMYFPFANYFTPGWFNANFGVSDIGPFPSNMVGRDRFRAPGYWDLDLGLYKTFRVRERVSLQLRGEAFNLFNHANLNANVGEADVASYDGMTASRFGRRNVQIAAKIIF